MTEYSFPNEFTIRTSYKFKSLNIFITPNFVIKKISRELLPIRKGSFQFIDKSTDVIYKLIEANKKEIFDTETTFHHTTQKNTLFAN